MRNTPLKGLLKKSPIKQQTKSIKQETKSIKPVTSTTGSVSTGGGLGLLVASAKEVWKGYGTTNKEITLNTINSNKIYDLLGKELSSIPRGKVYIRNNRLCISK